MSSPRRLPFVLLGVGALVFVWSGIAPKERFTWLMETLPAAAGGVALAATARRFPLTDLTYVAVFVFALILMVGGHWTYAEVPAGFWMRDALGLERNPFDRLGHLFQGITPALLAREVLVRRTPLDGRWAAGLAIAVAVAISGVYEVFEWLYAVAFGGEQAESFLGSQGDPWDAQADMAMALIGSTTAMLTLAGAQQRRIDRLGSA